MGVMKEEDLAWIEAKSAAGDYVNDEEIDKLLAEVRRLRRLPLIETCGDCRWFAIVGRDTVCTYEGASTPTKGSGAPPDGCPKRSTP
jgi:hypothetical protein